MRRETVRVVFGLRLQRFYALAAGHARQFPQFFDGLDYALDGKIDIRRSVEPAEAETQAAAGFVIAEAEGSQDMAGLGIGRRAGGPAADGQVAHREQQGFAVDVAERHVQIAGQADGRLVAA